MIILLLMDVVGFVLSAIFQLVPVVTTLPFGMDSALSYVIGNWNAFLQDFWLLQIVWQCVLFYYGFEISLLALRLIFGSRIR
jgi:hypothetical protein